MSADRPTSFWLRLLKQRRERMYDDKLDLSQPITWESEEERQSAIAFFNAVEVGTPVHVFGRTPRTREYFRYGPQPARPLYQRPMRPRFDPRFPPPVRENQIPDWN